MFVPGLIALGYKKIVVVDMETGTTHTSLGKKRVVEPGKTGSSEVLTIPPDVDLKSIVVDYLKASEEGVIRAYRNGHEDGMSAMEKGLWVNAFISY
jgi:hypothetical protein